MTLAEGVSADRARGATTTIEPVALAKQAATPPSRPHEYLGTPPLQWVLFCGIGVVGTTLSLLTTRRSVGLPTDSITYLGAAHNLLAGRGVTTPFTLFTSQYGPISAARFGSAVPLTHYPPLFPLAVSGVAAFGLSVVSAARFLNAALFGVNLVLVGLLTSKVTRARILPVAIVLLVLAGPVSFGSPFSAHNSWLVLHSSAMSEPLFITWSLLALLMLSRYLSTGRVQELLGASGFAGLALLTRYAGISLVIAAVIVIMLWGRGSRMARARASGLVLVVSLVPSVGWALYNWLVQHGTAPRELRSHPANVSNVFNVLEGWLTPADWPAPLRYGALLIAVLIVIAALVGLNTRRLLPNGDAGPFRLVFTFVCAYIAVVVLTRDFLDASTPFDDRLFAPLQALFYILLVSSIWLLLANGSTTQDGHASDTSLEVKGPRAARATLVCAAVCLLVALPGLRTTIDTVDNGFPRKPAPPQTLAAVEQLPRDVFIATNAGDSLWFQTGRASIGVPSQRVAITNKENTHFEPQLVELVSLVRITKGVVVIVTPNAFTSNLASQAYFVFFRSLHPLLSFSDGVILGPRGIVAQLSSQPPHIRLRMSRPTG